MQAVHLEKLIRPKLKSFVKKIHNILAVWFISKQTLTGSKNVEKEDLICILKFRKRKV